MFERPPRLTTLVVAVGLLLCAPAVAHAATVTSDGTTVTYTADPGADDVIAVSAGPITIARPSGEPANLVAGTGCAGGGATVTCALATRVAAALGEGNDALRVTGAVQTTVDGGAGSDVLLGGTAADVFTGGPGIDALLGGGGGDQILALDGLPDRIDCGGGVAQLDSVDVATSCGGAPVPTPVDADGDGAPVGQDCDDTNFTRYNGAPDLPANNVDEDCDGKDFVNLDVDGDGYKRPDDCNDRNPAIRPNAVEKRGNKVDENCDDRLQDFFPMDVLVTNSWAYSATQTRVNKLIVRGAPKRARVTVRCADKRHGCPFKRKQRKVVADNRGVDLTSLFRGARLQPGAKLRLRVKANNFITVTVTLTVRSLDVPTLKRTCREGKRKAKAC